MSLSQSLGISLTSMKNNQEALAVVSHNIANLNTKGYIKQRVNFSEVRLPVSSNDAVSIIHSLAGSTVNSLSGFVDNATFRNLVNTGADASYYNNLADALGDLEDVADALGDNGLNSLLNDFYSAAANLEQFPTDISIRQQYALALDNVCDKFNYITDKYTSIQEDNYEEVVNSIDNVNALLEDLATTNLAHIKNGNSPATQNQINGIIEQLANYAGVSFDQNENGSYNVYIGDVAVVSGVEQVYKLKSSFNEANDPPLTITMESLKDSTVTKDISDTIASGSLKANIDFLNGTNEKVGYTTVAEMKQAIIGARDAFKDALNAIQQYANDEDGEYAAYIKAENGELVLASDGAKPSKPMELLVTIDGKIQVNPEIIKNPYNIAAARINLNDFQPGEDWTKAIGNSDNAGLMGALRDEKICSYGAPNDCTLSQFLTNCAAKTGMDIASAQNKADVYDGIAESAAEDYANMTGVNLDEELADMIKYQRAFEASAKVFTAADYILQTIISMV